MQPKYILFDFDGVIVDSFAPAFETTKSMCPNTTEADYRKAFEGNIGDRDTSHIIHTDKCRHDIDFFEEFVPRLMAQATLFPGMQGVIKELAPKYKLAVISSTISAPIRELLDKFELSQYFNEIFGYDVNSSKVEKIKMIFEKYKTMPQDCVFVTDTLGDMREAEKAGVGAIGVSWGFQDKETLLRGKPFNIVDSPSALPSTISDYFKKIR